jgi:hypothetical protein
LTDVLLRLAEIAPAALVAAAAVTVIATETEVIARGGTATENEEVIVIVSGRIAIVGIGIIKIAEIGTAIIETRRRRTIVAAGAPTASAACHPSPSRKMMFLGLRLQPERAKVLACLPSVWIRTKLLRCLSRCCLCLAPQFRFCRVSQKVYCASVALLAFMIRILP